METRPFYQWQEELRRLGPEGFLAAHTAPFLVVYDPLPELEGEEAVFETGKLAALRPNRTTPRRPATGSLVMTVGKSVKVGNVFPGMITVGRARNNDVVLPSREVSSFHAWFSHEGGTWKVCDAESSNGTTVEGAPALKPLPVPTGAEVCFARVRCRFFLPPGFVELCQEAQA